MADLSVTAASCVPVAGTGIIETGVSGATITAGKPIYLESSSNTWKLADCDSATAEVRQATALALNGASAGQPVSYMRSGQVTLGATMTAGTVYYLSSTAGGICPVGDLTTGKYPCTIGIATSTTVLQLGFNYSGVAV